MELSFKAEHIKVDRGSYKHVDVTVENVEMGEIMDHFTLKDIIEYYGEKDILEAIGQDGAKEYFDLQEKE